MSLSPGAQIGRYAIRSRLGAGGMGEVYLAEDTKLHRPVALKILPAEFDHDQQRTARFLREAQAASALNHPNICTIYEINDETDVPFIAMEYVEGETLLQKIKAHNFDLTETLDIALQLADALAEAHAHGIIHRDIKPANIIINRRQRVKILDFGLAKRIAVASEAETQQLLSHGGMILGTIAYMSPEQARGFSVDARTDVWSFGVVLYEMLTGAKPFDGATASDLLAAILRSEPEDLRKFNGNVPAELERIILKTLRKERDERYMSAEDLYADLKQLQKQLESRPAAGRAAAARTDEASQAETRILEAKTTAQTAERNSIAVLSFSNMSAETENEYFCDGLAEELINSLAQIEGLKVAARTSAFSFKGQNANVQEVGKALNVKTILEGSVRKSGNKLRITVQLVNAADGYHLWSERYDREMKDIFDIQDEITLSVVDALSVKLLGAKKAAVLRRDTKNTEAYQTYLKGKYFLNKRKPDEFKKAVEFFRLATDMDPNYAPAYAGLADSYAMMAAYEVLPSDEAYPKAKAAAKKALELNDSLAEAHNSLAFILHNYDWDWKSAEHEYKRAIELNPNYATAHQWYALYLAYAGRFEEAEAENKCALEIDPLSLIINANRGLIMFTARRYGQAITFSRQAIEMDASFYQAHADLGRAYLEVGDAPKALAELQEARRLDNDPSVTAFLGYAYAVLGERDKAEQLIRELNELSKQMFVSPFFVATIYTGLGEKDQAFEWLEKALTARSYWLMCLNTDPQFERLRSDPRFTSLLRITGVITSETPAIESTGPARTTKLNNAARETKEAPTTQTAAESEQKPQNGSKKPRDRSKLNRRAWLIRLLLGLLILAALGLGYWLYVNRPAASSSKSATIESIAVMPFVNASADSNVEYLSDGITESLINNLARLRTLRVIARSTVFNLKGRNLEPQQIGKQLNVRAILNGRVAQHGDTLSIQVDLVDADSGSEIWGQNYQRKQTDVLQVQEEIAKDVTDRLRLTLTGEEQRLLTKRYTNNAAAYEDYLKGRYHYYNFTEADWHQALDAFNQAIVKDPNYALAYTGIADCYGIASAWLMPPTEAYPKLQEAALKALQIDNTLADAWAILASYKLFYEHDWASAERELKHALELNPESTDARLYYSFYLYASGRTDECLDVLRHALQSDPLSLPLNTNLAETFYYARRYDEALDVAGKMFEIDRESVFAHLFAGWAYQQKRQYEAAIAEFQQAKRLENIWATTALGNVSAVSGRKDEALKMLAELQAAAKGRYISPYFFALIYTGLGDRDQAFVWLNKAYDEHNDYLIYLKVEPLFDSLRDDPRFQDLLRRVGLAP